jgi:hypothetical protein
MIKVFSILILVSMLTLPFFAQAGLVPCGTETDADGKITNPCDLCHIFELIHNIIKWMALISIPLAVGVIAYGGIMLAAAGGSEANLEKGKKAISSAIIGLFLVFGAWLIINLILGSLLQKDLYLPWNEFPKCANRQQQ